MMKRGKAIKFDTANFVFIIVEYYIYIILVLNSIDINKSLINKRDLVKNKIKIRFLILKNLKNKIKLTLFY
jgi:hypothetical protein